MEASPQSVAVAANVTASIEYDHPCGDYLMVYATSAVADTDGQLAITAYDS
jgi:hypothetical protein